MKRTIIFGLIVGLLLSMQGAFASHIDGMEVVIGADGSYVRDYQYAGDYYGPEYRVYVDDDYGRYGRYDYRYSSGYNTPRYYFGGYNSRIRYLDNDYFYKRYVNKRIAQFVDRSAYSRYDITYGLNSEVFCDTVDCFDDDTSAENFRYKYTYDPRIDGLGNYQNYYYQPEQNSDTGIYNWRY